MPRNYKPKGLRAPNGSVDATVLLRIEPGALKRVRVLAKREGKSASEWLRGAVDAALERG